MPYLTRVERLAKEEGFRQGFEIGFRLGFELGVRSELFGSIAAGINHRFKGADGTLMAKIHTINDLVRLRSLRTHVWTVDSLESFQQLLQE